MIDGMNTSGVEAAYLIENNLHRERSWQSLKYIKHLCFEEVAPIAVTSCKKKNTYGDYT